jgi:molybdenum cofactor cytidylyltransferase
MTRAASFAGVILAAGESSRMGTNKALLPWPPRDPRQIASPDTFLSAAIRSLSQVADFVLVVAGKNESELAPVVYAEGESMVVNPDPDRGQFSSLQVGLKEVLNRGWDAAIVTLVDRPPVRTATIRQLRQAFLSAPMKTWSVVPEFEGKHGHPMVIGREMIEVFLQAPATATGREVEHKYQSHIEYVPVEDPYVALNINTPEEYAALLVRADSLR